MSKKIRVKPGRAGNVFGAIIGCVFVVLGVTMVIPTFGAFGIFWTLMAVCITGFSLFNALSKEGFTHYEIDVDDGILNDSANLDDLSVRLKKLDNLYQQNLISRDEYDAKRKEILGEL